jgi:hypothetical protein
LKEVRLTGVEDLSGLEEHVRFVYNYLNDNRVMRMGGNLIGAAKTLHHLLPELLMPVDKGNIIALLQQLENEVFRPSDDLEFMDYWKCIKVSHYIARQKGLPPRPTEEHIKKYPMDTSTPKMIDNALMGSSKLWRKRKP